MKLQRKGFHIQPIIFFRYLDDVFFLWSGSIEELKEYENYLNSITPGIKITLEANKLASNFLDITIYKKLIDNEYALYTKVYTKPTDAQNLLHTESFHPPHTAKGILKSQLIRYKRISSTYEDYLHAAKALFHNLNKRGYTWSKMWQMFKEVYFNNNNIETNKNNNREINNYDTTKKEMLPIVTNFNSIGCKLALDYRNILKDCSIFNKYKLTIAYKNHPNLHKMLERSEIQVDNNKDLNFKFTSKKCTNIKY